MHHGADAFIDAKTPEENLSLFSKKATVFALLSNHADENVHDRVVH